MWIYQVFAGGNEATVSLAGGESTQMLHDKFSVA